MALLGILGQRFPLGIRSVSVGVFFLAGMGLVASRRAAETGTAASTPLELRPLPISIRPQPWPCLSVPPADISSVQSKVQPFDDAASVSLFLHASRVFDIDRRYSRGKLATNRDTLRLFADEAFSKQILGTPLMVRTPHGIRCSTASGVVMQESHRDYCLAVLSEKALPSSFPMVVGGESFTLRDFLADSIANFHLGQEEIEWTALTYAAWIPPGRKWTTKFGQEFSFDDLANELMRRPLSKAICAGCHMLSAMTVLVRVDREVCPILSAEVRRSLGLRLREMVQEAEATQATDGSWSSDWYERKDRDRGAQRSEWSQESGSLGKRLLATGHVTEWLLILPEDLRVPTDRIERAGRWLHARLKDVDSTFVKAQFCACCHGAIVLQLVRDTADEVAVDQPRRAVTEIGGQVHSRRNGQ